MHAEIRAQGHRLSAYLDTVSLSLLRVLGEVKKQKLIHNNENLFGEFKHLKKIKQFNRLCDKKKPV